MRYYFLIKYIPINPKIIKFYINIFKKFIKLKFCERISLKYMYFDNNNQNEKNL